MSISYYWLSIISYYFARGLSHNLIGAIHWSFLSFLIPIQITSFFMLLWFNLWFGSSSTNTITLFNDVKYTITWLKLILAVSPILLFFYLLWLYIIHRLSDIIIESFIALTIIEQLSLIISIKLLLLSELMLFFACFWSSISFRPIGCTLLLFYFPLLSCLSFSIPFTNPLVPLFSSLPIQCSQIFIKIGFLNYSIEGLGQSLSAGFYFIIPQCKEFLYSYFSPTDCVIGPIYYFTTGLHGFHVVLGSFLFFILLFYNLFSSNYLPLYFMEFSFSLFFSIYYRHFVDFIWSVVFTLLMV